MKYRPTGGQQQYGGYNRPEQRNTGYRPPQGKVMNDLWNGYLKDGYFTQEGNTRRELLDREKFHPVLEDLSSNGLTNHQLRRFFQHCRAIETRLRSGKATWGQLAPDFLKIDAVAADAAGKMPPKIPGLFHDFIERNVRIVRNEKDFTEGFMRHFEALVGFASLYLKDKKN